MTRGLWDRFMIALMGAVIFFGLQQLWQSPAPLSESRYMLSIGIAMLVIVLKVKALRKAANEESSESGVRSPESGKEDK